MIYFTWLEYVVYITHIFKVLLVAGPFLFRFIISRLFIFIDLLSRDFLLF
nr:MAG TPA: hypothetical protein [Caudoviricetes sp.]